MRKRKTIMKIHPKDFRVRAGEEIKLKQWPTRVNRFYKSKEQYEKLLEEHKAELSDLQGLLYANSRYAVLLIFQAMDAAGKDSAIKHMKGGGNTQSCQGFSFKHPIAQEPADDFLLRATPALPRRR